MFAGSVPRETISVYTTFKMNWLRNRLRAWLGIESQGDIIYEQEKCLKIATERANMALTRIGELEKQPNFADISRKQFEIDAAIRELKEVRDQILDPKRVPIKTTRVGQYRQLMEQEP